MAQKTYCILDNNEAHIQNLLSACLKNDRAAQKELYRTYFSYGMSVALRYASNRKEAEEIFNDAFYKVFKRIEQYNRDYPFKAWFRQILINTSIDYQRKYKKLKPFAALEDQNINESADNFGYDNLVYEDLLEHIQKLPPTYRLVFNMYAIDGLKHHEIASELGISEGTSKSNYSRARKLLQTHILNSYDLNNYRSGR